MARKKDHIRVVSKLAEAQASGLSELKSVRLLHEALPEMNFQDVQSSLSLFGEQLQYPFLISSMTGGHQATKINRCLAEAAEEHGWAMGVGSQRRDLQDKKSAGEWRALRKHAPNAVLLGNLGLSQVIQTRVSEIQRLVDALEAQAFIVHLNPLQEALQNEGTPNFLGGLAAMEKLVKGLSVPVVIKEVGCGISASTLLKLDSVGVAAVDVAGAGGTHWGRVEVLRSNKMNLKSRVGRQFFDWGLSTVSCLRQIQGKNHRCQVWASGGVHTGVDAAKLIALGADMVGFAQVLLKAVLVGKNELHRKMEEIEMELKIAQFCTGSRLLKDLRREGVVQFEKE